MTRVRTDIVDVYVFRETPCGCELLQLRRSREPMAGSWHPVMGHSEPGERAVETALRELGEETGLAAGAGLLAFYQLEQVHPFFLAERDEIVLSPRFAARADAGWEPTLNDEHDAARWIRLERARESFCWPGQLASIAEIREVILAGASAAELLRIPGV